MPGEFLFGGPPDPAGAPLEKLYHPRQGFAAYGHDHSELVRLLIDGGVEPDMAENMAKGLMKYNEYLFSGLRENMEALERWANIHTHPGGGGSILDTGYYLVNRQKIDDREDNVKVSMWDSTIGVMCTYDESNSDLILYKVERDQGSYTVSSIASFEADIFHDGLTTVTPSLGVLSYYHNESLHIYLIERDGNNVSLGDSTSVSGISGTHILSAGASNNLLMSAYGWSSAGNYRRRIYAFDGSPSLLGSQLFDTNNPGVTLRHGNRISDSIVSAIGSGARLGVARVQLNLYEYLGSPDWWEEHSNSIVQWTQSGEGNNLNHVGIGLTRPFGGNKYAISWGRRAQGSISSDYRRGEVRVVEVSGTEVNTIGTYGSHQQSGDGGGHVFKNADYQHAKLIAFEGTDLAGYITKELDPEEPTLYPELWEWDLHSDDPETEPEVLDTYRLAEQPFYDLDLDSWGETNHGVMVYRTEDDGSWIGEVLRVPEMAFIDGTGRITVV